jgi:serine/threonine-protein kinase RsbW
MASEAPINCSIVVDSKPSSVDEVSEQVMSTLEENGFGKDDMFAIHLTLEEAFLNAVRHGNKMDPTKKVQIDYSVSEDKIEICVTDQGAGFEPETVADPRYGDGLYRPGGRGLLLMNSYMDVVSFNERGNSVYMVRYREKPSLTRKKDQTQT